MQKKLFFITILIFMSLNMLFAENLSYREYEITNIKNSIESDIPLWLLFERGKRAYKIGEFGLATRVFREILNRQEIHPDADMWLARIFFQEGEYSLAEKQYLKALDFKYQLYIPDDEFIINEELINLYKLTDQYGKYEEHIIELIEKNEANENILKLQYSMINLMNNRSLDKLFELYRYSNTKLNKIRTEIGEFYYKTGRYTEAEINMILPLLSVATKGFDYLYNKDIDYSYNSFSEHLANMFKYSELKMFAENNNFFENIYYLAAAFFANGNEKSSTELWNLIIDHDNSEDLWYKRAKRQLINPYIEPIITQQS